jgi:hypothetical protein
VAAGGGAGCGGGERSSRRERSPTSTTNAPPGSTSRTRSSTKRSSPPTAGRATSPTSRFSRSSWRSTSSGRRYDDEGMKRSALLAEASRLEVAERIELVEEIWETLSADPGALPVRPRTNRSSTPDLQTSKRTRRRAAPGPRFESGSNAAAVESSCRCSAPRRARSRECRGLVRVAVTGTRSRVPRSGRDCIRAAGRVSTHLPRRLSGASSGDRRPLPLPDQLHGVARRSGRRRLSPHGEEPTASTRTGILGRGHPGAGWCGDRVGLDYERPGCFDSGRILFRP